jgi:hypothetical protein
MGSCPSHPQVLIEHARNDGKLSLFNIVTQAPCKHNPRSAKRLWSVSGLIRKQRTLSNKEKQRKTKKKNKKQRKRKRKHTSSSTASKQAAMITRNNLTVGVGAHLGCLCTLGPNKTLEYNHANAYKQVAMRGSNHAMQPSQQTTTTSWSSQSTTSL